MVMKWATRAWRRGGVIFWDSRGLWWWQMWKAMRTGSEPFGSGFLICTPLFAVGVFADGFDPYTAAQINGWRFAALPLQWSSPIDWHLRPYMFEWDFTTKEEIL